MYNIGYNKDTLIGVIVDKNLDNMNLQTSKAFSEGNFIQTLQIVVAKRS